MVSVLRPGDRIHHIPAIGVQTSRRAVSVAAAIDWWAVTGKTCLAAYLAKGAASYAASKVNLDIPGTHDAGDGTAYPTWDAATGWKGNGSSQYLTTGIVPADAYTALVRYSGMTANTTFPFGTAKSTAPSGGFYLNPKNAGANIQYANGTFGSSVASIPPVASSGVIGFAGKSAYRNGSFDGSIAAGSGAYGAFGILLLAVGVDGVPLYFFDGYIQAFVIYSDTLTAGEVATVSAAMAAL